MIKRPKRYSWDEGYDDLVEYKKKFGHVNVEKYDWSLGAWVKLQHSKYSALMKGDTTRGDLTEEQIKKLKDVGFVFDIEKKEKRTSTR